MDETTKLKLKIGMHEFEAEGDPATVKASFEAFRELVNAANATPQIAVPAPLMAMAANPPVLVSEAANASDAMLDKIMRVDARVVSLTVRPKKADDAVLLVLYGQKRLRENDSVTGSEIIDGITATGGLQISRVDRLLDKAGREGDVIVIGERRGRRYRLTNAGVAKARALAADLIAIVA